MDTNDTIKPETQPEPSQARCAVPICSASVLRDFNAWRRNECDYIEPPHSAKRIGEAIDDAVKALSAWLPIESAKINNFRVLGWCPVWDACFVVKWSPGRPAPHWTTDDGAVTSHAPTHWRFLPSPPNTP